MPSSVDGDWDIVINYHQDQTSLGCEFECDMNIATTGNKEGNCWPVECTFSNFTGTCHFTSFPTMKGWFNEDTNIRLLDVYDTTTVNWDCGDSPSSYTYRLCARAHNYDSTKQEYDGLKKPANVDYNFEKQAAGSHRSTWTATRIGGPYILTT